MDKIVCPECKSFNVNFGKSHTIFISWDQNEEDPTYWYDDDRGTPHEIDDAPIECYCLSCSHRWALKGLVEDYLE